MMISQQDGARLMYAANSWVEATIEYQSNPVKSQDAKLLAELEAAEHAFAELVAQLTDSEGL